jgi:hypothetical protein
MDISVTIVLGEIQLVTCSYKGIIQWHCDQSIDHQKYYKYTVDQQTLAIVLIWRVKKIVQLKRRHHFRFNVKHTMLFFFVTLNNKYAKNVTILSKISNLICRHHFQIYSIVDTHLRFTVLFQPAEHTARQLSEVSDRYWCIKRLEQSVHGLLELLRTKITTNLLIVWWCFPMNMVCDKKYCFNCAGKYMVHWLLQI